MKKQTAVEWLVDELRNYIKEHGRLDAITISELKMEAKEIEKEQIEWAYLQAYNDCSLGRFSDSEKYYNDKYL